MSGIELALWSVDIIWSVTVTLSTGCVIMWQLLTFSIIYSAVDAGSTCVTGCMRLAKCGAKDAGCEPPCGQVSMTGKLPAPAAADAATRKKAGLSVAIGRAGPELAELTCHTTGALAGWAERESAGTRTRPAEARTGWDATNVGGGCWLSDAEIKRWWCCCGGDIGTAKL